MVGEGGRYLDVFPIPGTKPLGDITAARPLAMVKHIESRGGAVDAARPMTITRLLAATTVGRKRDRVFPGPEERTSPRGWEQWTARFPPEGDGSHIPMYVSCPQSTSTSVSLH